MSNTTGLKAYDAFAGIGAFHLAAAKHGIETIGACEIDARLRQHYEDTFDTPCDGDINDIDQQAMPDFDVLFGGSPCVSFSPTGLQKGFDDDRGMLMFRLMEIADVKRPRFVVIENVQRLLTHNKGRSVKAVFDRFDELGYSTNYIKLSPHQIGIPQVRDRVFIIAELGSSMPATPTIPDTPCPDLRDWIDYHADPSDWSTGSGKLNAALDEWLRILETNRQMPTMHMDSYIDNAKDFRKSARKLHFHDPSIPLSECLVRWETDCIKAYHPSLSPTLKHESRPAMIMQHPDRRMLSTAECARLQSYPFELLDGLTRAQRYEALGNSVNVDVASMIVSMLGQHADHSMLTPE